MVDNLVFRWPKPLFIFHGFGGSWQIHIIHGLSWHVKVKSATFKTQNPYDIRKY